MGPNEGRGPEPAALDASEKGRGGPVRRLWMKTLRTNITNLIVSSIERILIALYFLLETEQMASYAVTAVHPAEPASNIVLQKRLSNSDVSGQVLKTGRIVLPRGFVSCARLCDTQGDEDSASNSACASLFQVQLSNPASFHRRWKRLPPILLQLGV